MTLAAGTKFGPYEIMGPLGAGGMGEVYRARDTRLGREVAIKVLPEAVARDAERMGRLRREAQVLASLNHPNIAAIYGFEDTNNAPALVMELVEGSTLGDRIKTGTIPAEEALPIAKQIAEAVEYAHERGIIHRDLKPANIKLADADAVKILDFGLAKALESEMSPADISSSPTISQMATQAGMILGTAAYMSPEQAKGKSVDRRADIWAFGCVLFEMLSGKQSFGGETTTDILAAVVRGEPDWTQLPPATPPRVRGLLERCLRKEPKQRLQSMGDARIAIEEILSGAPAEARADSPIVERRSNREPIAWSLVVALGIVAVGLGVWSALRPASPSPSPVLAYIPPPPGTSFRAFGFSAGPVVVSPDGKQLAFSATDQSGVTKLWIRPLSLSQATSLAGTEDAAAPFWSPDSRSLGFFANGKLKTVDLDNVSIQVLSDALCPDSFSGAWGKGGTILFTPRCHAPLNQILASGGSPRIVTKLEENEWEHRSPAFLPDGRQFVYAVLGKDRSNSIWAATLDSNEKRIVLKDASSPQFASGCLLFVGSAGRVFAQQFDPGRGRLSGNPVLLAESQNYSVSGNGVLAYQGGSQEGRLEWFDRSGNPAGSIGETAVYASAKISPDDAHVLADIEDTQSPVSDLWSFPAAGGVGTRLTFGPGSKAFSVWSPDGKYVAYSCQTGGKLGLCRKPADGSGAEENLFTFNSEIGVADVVDWSPEGRYLSFDVHNIKDSRWGNWILSLSGEVKQFQVAPETADQYDGNFSPDGRWLAYFSYESGRPEVYVVPFPGPGGKFQISQSGGWLVRWDKKNHLYFLTMGNRLMEADLAMNEKSVQVKSIHPLFQLAVPSTSNPFFDVNSDGSRFLVITAADPTASQSITVLLNWEAKLNQP
jgi:serine/threonine protein kinase